MTFAEEMLELHELEVEALAQHKQAVARMVERLDREIMHQQSDLQNALDDLENQTALTQTLKDKLEERKP